MKNVEIINIQPQQFSFQSLFFDRLQNKMLLKMLLAQRSYHFEEIGLVERAVELVKEVLEFDGKSAVDNQAVLGWRNAFLFSSS